MYLLFVVIWEGHKNLKRKIMTSNIGKQFTMYNYDETVMIQFIIKKEKLRTTKAMTHEDGTTSPDFSRLLVSDGSSSWFAVYNLNCKIEKV